MAKRLSYMFYQICWTTLDWVLPPKCGGCGKTRSRWCAQCHASVNKIEPPICSLCGQKISHDELCPRCQRIKPHYNALRSWAVFEGNIRNAIHQLKYKQNVGLGDILSRSLVELFQSLDWEIDAITPVPLGLARLAERGYNQSSLLAKPLALALNISYSPAILSRTRETRSQVGLTAAERRMNVTGAFIARPNLADTKSVLVVDDVTTSGATLEACADALLAAGARQVYGLTLARAVFKLPQLSDQPILDS
jgi:competence protein ComFC